MSPRKGSHGTPEEEQAQQQQDQHQEQQQTQLQNCFVSESRNRESWDQAYRAELSPSEDSTTSDGEFAEEYLARIRLDATQYMEHFGLPAFFQNMIQRMMMERPKNPFEFMLEFLHSGRAVPSRTPTAGMNTTSENEIRTELSAIVAEKEQLLLRNVELEQQLADAILLQQRSANDANALGKGNEVQQLLEQQLAQHRKQLVEMRRKVLRSESCAQHSRNQLAAFKQQLEAAMASVAVHSRHVQHMEQKLQEAEERTAALSIEVAERSSEKNFLRELQYQEQLAESQAQLQAHGRRMVELQRLTRVAVKQHTEMLVSNSEAWTQRGGMDNKTVLEVRAREAEARHADAVETFKKFELLLTGASLD